MTDRVPGETLDRAVVGRNVPEGATLRDLVGDEQPTLLAFLRHLG